MSERYDRDLEPVTAPEPATLPSEHHRDRRSLLARLLAPLVVLLGVVLKFGAFVLKFFGIFLAVGGYALIWGWRFGVGVVLLILAHELGHYVEAQAAGLDPQLPVFIPFLGRVRRAAQHALRPVGATRASRSQGRWPAGWRRSRASSRPSRSTPTSCARSRTRASSST